MIEITKLEEINSIESAKIRIYLKTRFREIGGYELNPLIDGSFLYIKDTELLKQSHQLQGVTLPSIGQGLFTHIEAVTVHLGIFEISLLFNNEYLLSIIVDENSCSEEFLQLIGLEVFSEK